jgi:hypothetical protein
VDISCGFIGAPRARAGMVEEMANLTWCACGVVPRIAKPQRDSKGHVSELQPLGCLGLCVMGFWKERPED